MSRPALVVAGIIVMATVVLEVVAYLVYRDSVDGQAVLPAFFLIIFALVAISFVYAGDQAVRQFREARQKRFANRSAKPSQ